MQRIRYRKLVNRKKNSTLKLSDRRQFKITAVILIFILVVTGCTYYLIKKKDSTYRGIYHKSELLKPSHSRTLNTPSPTYPNSISPTLSEELIRDVRSNGDVFVIVTLNIEYSPEANLVNKEDIDKQRAAIRSAQDELVASITNGNVHIESRLTILPQIMLRVDEAALRQLSTSSLVKSINANDVAAPNN